MRNELPSWFASDLIDNDVIFGEPVVTEIKFGSIVSRHPERRLAGPKVKANPIGPEHVKQ